MRSFDRHGLREVPRLVDVGAFEVRDVIREELERHHREQREDALVRRGDLEHVIGEPFGLFVALFMVYGGFSIAFFISQFAIQPLKAILPATVVTAVQLVLIALLFIFFILGLLKEARLGAQKAR